MRNAYLDLNTQAWYADAVGKYDQYNLTSSHVQNVIKGERPWVITLSRGIRNYTGTTADDGVVFLDLNYSAISELCAQSSMGDKGYVFILDQDGNIVYHPRQQQLYNELQTENISLVMNAESDIVTVGKGDDEKIYALSHSEITGWTIVGCMNMSELLRNSRQTRSIYVLVALGLIIVALLISSVIARNITMPIQKLRDSMKSVQKGNFDIEDIEVLTDNEIGSLTRSFNVMTHRIRELMEQNIQEQEQKRKIELKALQSQINPHFLYNTLDSIIWMIRSEEYEGAGKMVSLLAKFFRISLSQGKDMIPLEKELEHASSYLAIQNIRFKDKFEFQIEADPALLKYLCPKLSIQPLLENAIYHGMEGMYEDGEITIRIYDRDGDIGIDVADNGPGMTQETIDHIMHNKVISSKRGSGIGVRNVNERIQLIYGEDYGVTITSELDEGTTATITIPKMEETDDAR